jgi:transposase InsO family protein
MPGELIHVDVKKLAGIPNGGGWRVRGRGYHGEHANSRKAGYRYIHTAVDDRTRIAYSEIHNDEKAATAAGFWARAAAWYQAIGIEPERVITDNGSCYRSGLWHRACAATGTKVRKTRSRRPQTNGKVERFHRILLEEWAYIQPWTSESQRFDAYVGFIHFYNHHRAHGALGWATPTSILRDNLPKEHN